ncbi:MAG: carboxypeptidase regulatory-like domain-containing protein [Candidatus Eisenbacteria bacterium]|nr:carboxypeptidase regulatory-like domain-containing protein [Candidatus Eisenbacteria bacterium]
MAGPYAQGTAGDVLLENGRIRVVISGVDHALGAAASGGRIIDAAPVGGEDAWGQSVLALTEEFPRQVRYKEMELIEPGAFGGTAGVRFLGEDSRVDDIEIRTEYLLGEGDSYITIRTVYHYGMHHDQEEGIAADRIECGGALPFLPGFGFLAEGEPPEEIDPDPSMLILVGETTCYGWTSREGDGFTPLRDGAIRYRLRRFRVPAMGERVLERRLWVVRGDPAALRAAAVDEPSILVEGRVEGNRSGDPVAGAWVELLGAAGLVTAARTDDEGRFRAWLPPGDDYRARAVFPEGRAGRDKRFRVEPDRPVSIDLHAEENAVIHFVIQDDGGVSVAGKVTVCEERGGPPARESGRIAPRAVAYAGDGEGTIRLPEGRYRLVASRGIAWSLDEREMRLRSGDREEVVFRIRREVDETGLTPADLDLRTTAGLRSPVPAAERIEAARAEGLRAAVIADRGVVTLVPSLPAFLVVPGEEIVLRDIGRFVVFPVDPDRAIQPLGGRGAEGKTPGELFRLFRRRPGPPLVMVHAPRSAEEGYFRSMGVDPVTGLSNNLEFETGFDLVEVATGTSLEDAGDVLADWFHLLNLGHRLFAAGSSASDGGDRASAGMPRVLVETREGSLTRETFLGALGEGRSSLTTGPLVRLRVNGAGRSGDLVPDDDGLVELAVRVEAAEWIDVDRIRVFGNGAPVLSPAVRSGGGTVRCDVRETLAIYRDTWFVVVVSGDRSLDPVYTGPSGGPVLPVAVTNPIWVDFNGNGRFDPPGAR